MHEGVPQMPVEPNPEEEKGIPSYERSLEAARALRVANIADPFDMENPVVQEAQDKIQEWERSKDLHMRGIGNAEKANDIVKASLLFIESGYTDEKFIQEALTRLRDEFADAIRQEGNDDIRKILEDAIVSLEQKLTPDRPKESVEGKFDGLMENAVELARTRDRDKCIEAAKSIVTILINSAHKPYLAKHPEEKARMMALKDAIQKIRDGAAPDILDSI